MGSYTWNGVTGHWRIASDWTPAGGPPTASDAATIDGSGTYVVFVYLSDVASSLTLSDANAKLIDAGPSASLTIGGTLTMSNGTLIVSHRDGGSLTVGALNLSAGLLNIGPKGELHLNGTLRQTGGTLTLGPGGTISGGTIDSTGGKLRFDGGFHGLDAGTLSGVTIDGPLNLTANNASVRFAGGTRVVGSSGSGPGTINDTGAGSHLFFNYSDNTQTVSNTSINLGNAISYSEIEQDDSHVKNLVLTLASSVTIDVAGHAFIDGGISSGDEIVNQGVINVTGTHGYLTVYGADFTNEGTINIANGDSVVLDALTLTTTASSVIAIGANSSLILSWDSSSNLGSITLASGAYLDIGGSATTADLGSIVNSGGTVDIGGTLNISGETLNGSESFGELGLSNGTISGGTATSAGIAFTGIQAAR